MVTATWLAINACRTRVRGCASRVASDWSGSHRVSRTIGMALHRSVTTAARPRVTKTTVPFTPILAAKNGAERGDLHPEESNQSDSQRQPTHPRPLPRGRMTQPRVAAPAAPSGAEGAAHRQFRLSIEGTREQKLTHVHTCNQQQQHRRCHHDPDRLPVAAEERLLKRLYAHAESGITPIRSLAIQPRDAPSL